MELGTHRDSHSPRPGAGARPGGGAEPIVELAGIGKRYGHTVALDGASVSVSAGEVVSIVGHNGAGKSTLVRVLCGLTKADEGRVVLRGQDETDSHSFPTARRAGIRIAFQEFSLCPSLRVDENVLIGHPELSGVGWRRRCGQAIVAQLDEIFAGHGISPRQPVVSLSLAERQMLEVARAAMRVDEEIGLLLLDEPNSALGAHASHQLFEWVNRRRDEDLAVILISHRLAEVVEHSDRLVVMRDGSVVDDRPAAGVTRDQIVALMGQAGDGEEAGRPVAAAAADGRVAERVLEVDGMGSAGLRDVSFRVGAGEIVGLAGLDGQGQRELLAELWRLRGRRRGPVDHPGEMAFVSGDRQEAGLFKLWSFTENVSLGALRGLCRGPVLLRSRERRLAEEWAERLEIRTGLDDAVTGLSGGTQQKTVIARALATEADLVLLDDPFRGVDSGTKRDTYRLMREEATRGRSFLWFTTEMEELEECDRVYVMREGAIAAELGRGEIREDRIVDASFAAAETRQEVPL